MRCSCRPILALLILASVLAGCNLSTQESAPDPQTATVPTATPVPVAVFPDIDTFLIDLMALYDIPGAGIALVQNGEVLYTQGYGVRSTATAAPVTPDTQFAIGSITKSFTALGLLRLVDQGRVALDVPVITYWPDFTLSDPTAAQQVTVRHLLAQTSGLSGAGDGAWYSGQITTLRQAVDYAATLPLADAPGRSHIYDNYNYAIAGYLIEQVTGQTWPDVMRDQILAPLGISAATFDIQAVQQTPDYALPHSLDIRAGMQPAPFVSLAGIASAGAINASARDMAQYVRFQLGNGQPLIASALLDEMHTRQAAYGPMPPVGPTGFQTNGYALGWFTAGFNGLTVLWHNGSIDGFYAMVMFIPSENVGVAVLSNAGLGTGSLFTLAASLGLLERLAGIDAGRDVVAALNTEAGFDPADRQTKLDQARRYQADPAAWTSFLGDYGGVLVTAQGSALYVDGLGSRRVELVPTSPTDFITANRERDGLITTFTFVTGADGSVTLLLDGVQVGWKGS